jgi:alanyl-tRNA synthetase
MKEAMAQLGGRGGGSTDLAQGGLPAGAQTTEVIGALLHQAAASLKVG